MCIRDSGWSGTILEFEESSATVELAAAKVGTEPARIAKTLGFYAVSYTHLDVYKRQAIDAVPLE